MDAGTEKAIERLKKDQALAQRIMSGGDGQRLMTLLSGNDGGAALSQAMQQAQSGDTKALASLLGGIVKSGEGAALMQRLNRQARE